MRSKRISHIEVFDSLRILRVSQEALKVFLRYEQKKGCREAGGILLGKVFPDYDEVLKALPPNRYDSRKYFHFIRAKNPAQKKINNAWKKSLGTMIYLGEWHTHPEANPIPSGEDKEMIKKSLRETEMEIDFLYLIVVGIAETLWVGRQSNDGLIHLK